MNNDPTDAIMEVMESAFDPRFGEAWTRRQVSDSLVIPNTHYIIDCTNDGEVRGFTLSRSAADEEELLLIAVKPEYREAGHGKALLKRFLDAARSRGASRIFLEMRSDNPAIHVYRKCGFEQVGLRRGYYRGAIGGPLDAITFALSLN